MDSSNQNGSETNSFNDSPQAQKKIFNSGRLATVVVKQSFFKKKKKIT